MMHLAYAHKTIWLYYSTNFLPQLTFFLNKPTYSRYKLLDSKITNYWYKTFELPILFVSYKLEILILQTTNPIC